MYRTRLHRLELMKVALEVMLDLESLIRTALAPCLGEDGYVLGVGGRGLDVFCSAKR